MSPAKDNLHRDNLQSNYVYMHKVVPSNYTASCRRRDEAAVAQQGLGGRFAASEILHKLHECSNSAAAYHGHQAETPPPCERLHVHL